MSNESSSTDDRDSIFQVPNWGSDFHTKMMARSDIPTFGCYASDKLVVGAGVVIFHLATARVILCFHSKDKYWFLPKGRRDANEDTTYGAEREGFEESGYRNRLLPIPLPHRQPRPVNPSNEGSSKYACEAVWTQLMPMNSVQYILFWYIAETVPPEVEGELNQRQAEQSTPKNPTPYQYPPKYPDNLTLSQRLSMEPKDYEPVHHQNTAVDSEEALYRSFLLPVQEAAEKLGGGVQSDVVRRGWQAICQRYKMESENEVTATH